MRTTIVTDEQLEHTQFGNTLAHYGVKGMKWGKHKSRVATFVDQRITGASAKAARDQYLREAAFEEKQKNLAMNSVSVLNQKATEHNENAATIKSSIRSSPIGGVLTRKNPIDAANRQIAEEKRKAANASTTAQMQGKVVMQHQSAQHKAQANAASANRDYSKSLAGKISGYRVLRKKKASK